MDANIKKIYNSIDISCVNSAHLYTEFDEACDIAIKNQFAAVVVLPAFLPYIKSKLRGQNIVKIGSTIGFPSGSDLAEDKIFQAYNLCNTGCEEFDMVMNLSWLKNKEYESIINEIELIKREINKNTLKVIIEAHLLSDEEIAVACDLIATGGADYVKSATGWTGVTTEENLKKIIEKSGNQLKVKAAGGINTIDKLMRMHAMGCNRFGLSLKSWKSIQNII